MESYMNRIITTGVAGAAIVAASLSSLTAQNQAQSTQAAPAAAQEQDGGRGGRAGGGRGGGRGGATMKPSALRAIPAEATAAKYKDCLLYTSPSPRD